MKIYILILFVSIACFSQDKKEKSAIVIIDMQPQFVTRGGNQDAISNVKKVDDIIHHQIEIINDAKSRGIPIIVVEYVDYGKTNKDLKDALKGYKNKKTFIKNTDGMFSNRNLTTREIKKTLDDKGIKNLVILGANGGACVKRSIKGALSSDYNVVAYSKGIADFNYKDFVYPYNDKYKFKTDNCEFKEIDDCEGVCELLDDSEQINLGSVDKEEQSWGEYLKSFFIKEN